MVILPATGERGAWRLAERIREAVAELKVPVPGKDSSVSVTISVGVRTHRPQDTTVGMLIHEADEAMYHAKRTGRNRTCAFEDMAA
jgi:diguanylate cyclase (GGDEF)-like protein